MRDSAPVYQGLRIYPRGFLGASLGVDGSTTDRPFMSQLQTHQYHPSMFRSNQAPKEVNHNVEKLWKRTLSAQNVMGDIEFREKILRVALSAFGTHDFYAWVTTNIKGPSTGDMHVEFIEDTLRFINTGKRRMSLHNWTAVLTLSQIESNQTKTNTLGSYFVDPDTRGNMNMSLIDVLQRWCGNEGGFEDLSQTLHVLFGDVQV